MSEIVSERSARSGSASVPAEPVLSVRPYVGSAGEMQTPTDSGKNPAQHDFAANGILFGLYAVLLWFVMGQTDVYLRLLKDLGVWPLARRRMSEDRAETPVA
jgi:hypothetical protein